MFYKKGDENDMFITRTAYDKLNARNVELARNLKEKEEENKYLQEENKDLRNDNIEQRDSFREIIKVSENNNYGKPEVIIGKMKELAQTAINN